MMFHIFLNTYICQARFKCFTHMLPGLTQYYCHPEWYYWSLWPVLLRSLFSAPLRQIAMSGTQFLHLFKTRQIILHCAYMSVQVNTRRDYIENDILVRVNWLINGGDSVYFFFEELPDFCKVKNSCAISHSDQECVRIPILHILGNIIRWRFAHKPFYRV